MPNSQSNIDLSALQTVILGWLKSRVDGDGYKWLVSKHEQLQADTEDWEFFTSFSAVPRHIGKNLAKLSDGELKKADELRSGWDPSRWTVDQLGRTLMVLSLADQDQKGFLDVLDKTFVSSDMGEAVALYQSISLLPYPGKLQDRAAEGIRSNITSVFNAVALDNPYPAEFMSEDAFNQIVLKALFVGSPLYRIKGIDDRTNETLAQMLSDYAHERWAAGRSVSPELWRPVGPFAKNGLIDDLKKVLDNPDKINRQAAILALSASSSEKAQKLLKEHSDLKRNTEQVGVSWDDIGRRVNEP